MADDELGPLGSAVLGAVLLGVGIFVILGTAHAERRIDLLDKCQPTESGKCFSLENGIVESADSEAVRVLYDDGRRSAKLTLVTATYPAPGTRVRLERWDGDIVSIYDLGTERRYRTNRWPDVDDFAKPFGWGLVLVGGLQLAWGLLGVWTRVHNRRERL